MGRKANILESVGKISGIVALVGLVLTLAAYFMLYGISAGAGIPIGILGLYLPAAVFILGSTGWLVSKLSLIFFVSEETGEDTGAEEVVKDSGYYLKEFNKANRYVAMFFGFLLLISLSSSALTSAASGTPLGVFAGFLVFGAKMLGGTIVHLLNTVWFAGSWYGIEDYQAKEAWIASLLGWSLFTLSGLLLLSSSLGAIAIVVAGLKVLSYGWKSRGETRIKFTEEYIRGTELEKYLLEK